MVGFLHESIHHILTVLLRANQIFKKEVLNQCIFGVLHNTSNISENTRKNGCVIIEGTPYENNMAEKGHRNSERASS